MTTSEAGSNHSLSRVPVPEVKARSAAPVSVGATRWPLITLMVCGAAALLTTNATCRIACIDLPFASLWRDPWRPFTGHLVHSNTAHLVLNLATFLPFAWLRERQVGAVRLILELLVLAMAVAIGIRLWHADWSSYQGLSGVVYGLVALQLLATRDKEKRTVAALVITLMATKSFYELTVGTPVGGVWLEKTLDLRYLAGSHCAGLLGGLTLAAVGWERTQGEEGSRRASR